MKRKRKRWVHASSERLWLLRRRVGTSHDAAYGLAVVQWYRTILSRGGRQAMGCSWAVCTGQPIAMGFVREAVRVVATVCVHSFFFFLGESVIYERGHEMREADGVLGDDRRMHM
jgi:hypothetical protein